ncbi:tRNA threonylcarbamoyladenosine biosynthesis protein TsaE [bacterium HR30]|nr:tRNA threonylcarbamoyladenosine biosynthesis protein TsaE [bacterium HR30]
MVGDVTQFYPLVTLSLNGEHATRALGAALAKVVSAGDRIGLCGPLGVGKTALVRGLAEGLGIGADKVRSPTFTLVNEYQGGRLPLYHIDFYRLDATELDLLALREVLYGDGVAAVEWWDRVRGESCNVRVDLHFATGTRRTVTVTAFDSRYRHWIDSLEEQAPAWL